MNQAQYNKLFSFLWNIANDVLVHAFNKGDYKDIIMPMLVLRRIDVLLEPTKAKVLERKAQLDKYGIANQDQALCMVSGFPFYNISQFTLKTLINETDPQRLKQNFIDYINGYSEDVLDILDKLRLRTQIDFLTETGRLGSLIQKFTDTTINLSIKPVLDDEGNEILPALDNHTMGTVFEELLRKFSEENNVTEAGEHFTPRDYVKLLADLAVLPVKHQLLDGTPYSIYDGACGTGGILSIAQKRINKFFPKSNISLYGQEIQANTFATCKADMMISGVLPRTTYSLHGNVRKYIAFGSTISSDGHPGETYDFCISNPPFGTPWKEDLYKKGLTDKEKKKFNDSRFFRGYDGAISFIPDISDCQMLFLANNVSRMKDTPLGTRIVEIHNGSSLFTGKAGGGESNLRRYIIENDLLEAIIALPEKMFYNTPISTYVWIVTNRKSPNRKGKVQLINATEIKSSMRKNLGDKGNEVSLEDREQILKLLMNFEETPESKIFDNEEFGYWEVPVLRPKRDKDGNIVYKKAKKSQEPEIKYTKNRNESERVPLTYPGGVEAFFENEVAPYDSEARFGEPILGYELSFTKYFPKPVILRTTAEIQKDIDLLNQRISENSVLNSSFFQRENESSGSIGQWGENFPNDWKIVKGRRIFEEVSIKGNVNERFIAVTQDRALIYKDEGDVNFVTASDPSAQKLVCPNQFVISLRSFQGGLELLSIRGLISPAYTVFKLKDKYDTEKMRLFFKALFKSKPYVALLNSLSDSLRDGKSIKFAEVANFDYPLPPQSFLDSFCCLVNNYESLQQTYVQLEGLLSEYRQRLIADVVTGQIKVN